MFGVSYEVSVIVPAYNRAGLVGETLHAIRNQTIPPAEIILVDDGSTDDTGRTVGLLGPGIRYHRIENSGPAAARHAGVRLSSAPWIAFCDSDDVWLPEKLEKQTNLLREAPGLEYCFTDYSLLHDGTIAQRTKFQEVDPAVWPGMFRRRILPSGWVFTEPLYPLILQFCMSSPVTALMSRDFYDRVGGFDLGMSRVVSEDWEFTLRCVQEAPLGVVPEPLVAVRKHGTNLSRDQLANLLGEITILLHALAAHRDAGKYRPQLEQERIRRTCQAAELAFANADLALTRALCDALPSSERSGKLQVKAAVSRLPNAAAKPLCKLLLAASGATGALRRAARREDAASAATKA